jgi:hypothetical protein
MANSQDNPFEGEQLRFGLLGALYTISRGDSIARVNFENLFTQLRANNEIEQRMIHEAFDDLRQLGFAHSPALGTAGITHNGINEFENAVLGPRENMVHFSENTIENLITKEQRNHVGTNRDQRNRFLERARELSRANRGQRLNSGEIGNSLGFDQETVNRIHFFLQDEGLIEPFAAGGTFTLPREL